MNNLYSFYDKFILRLPLYPLSYYNNNHLIDDNMFREAIMLSSKDFFDLINDCDFMTLQHQLSMNKYQMRACSRCTPFGLFASCSIGCLSAQTSVCISSNGDSLMRKTRLDMGYIHNLINQLVQSDDILKKKINYYPNNSLYKVLNEYRYTEGYYDDGNLQYRLTSIESNTILNKIITLGRSGLPLDNYVRLIVEEGIDSLNAQEYVNDLIDSQILRSELDVNVTGSDTLFRIIHYLQQYSPESKCLAVLLNIKRLLMDVDRASYRFPIYDRILDELRQLSLPIDNNKIFQCDAIRVEKKITLSYKVISRIQAALNLLNKIIPLKENPKLIDFKTYFLSHFNEDEKVSLLKILDPEIGYRYTKTNIIHSEIIGDIAFPSQFDITFPVSLAEQILLKKIVEAVSLNKDTVELVDNDFSMLPKNPEDRLPSTFSVLTRIINEDNIYFELAGGSSGANIISRFAYLHTEFEELAKEIASKDEELNNESIIAEIIHLPNGRTGNILMRPILHQYEINYLSHSQTKSDYQIPLSDLFVTVSRGEIILYSKRLNKRIIPRLTNAHNYSYNSLPIYNFLCDLQFQGVKGVLNLELSEIFNIFDKIPRIKYKSCILSRLKWKINRALVETWRKYLHNESLIISEVRKWRKQFNIPQLVTYSEGDNELLIDLDSFIGVNHILLLSKKHMSFYIEEFLFMPNEGLVKDDRNNYYCNEFIFFMHKNN